MIYEPISAQKKMIIIGSVAVAVAVLAAALAFLSYRSEKSRTSNEDILAEEKRLEEKKFRKEFDELEEMRKSQNKQFLNEEDARREFDELEKERNESNVSPSSEE